MEQIKFKGKSYFFEAEVLSIDNLEELSKEDAKELLFKMQDALNDCQIKMYLTYGTLLGAIREKDFITGDLDVDVYVDDEEKLFDSLGRIESHGLHLVRVIPRTVFTFRLNKRCFIDIYIVKKNFISIWSVYCYKHSTCYIPKHYFDGEIEIPFLGRNFLCVEKPQELLKFWYGETWNIPVSKDIVRKYYYTVKSHYYYSKLISLMKIFTRIIVGDKIYESLKKKVYKR